MNKFPDNLTKQSCQELKKEYQLKLMENVRERFYNTIMADTKRCGRYSILEFPENLYRENRINICNELFERFDRMKMEFDCKDPTISTRVEQPLIKTFCNEHELNEFICLTKKYKQSCAAKIRGIKLYY